MEELGLLRPYRYPAVLMFHCSCQSSSPFDPLWGGSFTAASRKDPRSLWIGVRQIFWKPGGVDLKKNGWLELGNCLEMLGKCLEFWMITSFPKWQWGMPHTDTSELNWRRFFLKWIESTNRNCYKFITQQTFVTMGRLGKVSSQSK
jgi:hypothetical protein